MDLKNVLNLSRHHKRAFIGILILIVLLLVIIDLKFLQPVSTAAETSNIWSNYVQSIVAALIVALFTFGVIQYFLPDDTEAKAMSNLEPTKITAAFELQLANATSWQYRGNFGRYLRGKVLPTLSAKTGMRISACIIDPKDIDLCVEHSQYRTQINGIDKGKIYTVPIVQEEVLTTILICAWYAKSKSVTIDLYLTSVFDPIRTDASDKSMIVTVEDRRESALLIQRSHFMFDHFGLQVLNVQKQGTKINLDSLPFRQSLSDITSEDAKQFFESIEMTAICEQIGAETIIQRCINVKNPYGS